MTFRCGEAILKYARPLLPGTKSPGAAQGSQRAGARGLVIWREYDDERAEAEAVVSWVSTLAIKGMPKIALAAEESTEVRPEQVAILARSRNALREVLAELNRRGTAHHFSTGDSGLFDTEEYTAILHAIKALASGRDLAIVRSLIASLRQTSLAENLGDYDDGNLEPAALFTRIAKDLAGTHLAVPMTVLANAAGHRGAAIAPFVEGLLAWEPQMDLGEAEKAELLAGDREVFQQRWIAYRNRPESAQRGWHGLLLELVTTPRPEAEGVRVLTVHAAKGLEFKAIALVGLNQGTFPDFRNVGASELDDERRLMYVALTRASRLALLTRPKVRATRFGPKSQDPSRFLFQIGLLGS